MRYEYKPINMEIGSRIRIYRETIGLTRDLFSERVGVTPRFVADVECGRVGVSLTTLRKICEVLGVSADNILWDNREKVCSSAERISFMLLSVDSKLRPVLERSIQDQIALIEAAQRVSVEPKKEDPKND